MSDLRCDGSKRLAELKNSVRNESMTLIKCRDFRGRCRPHDIVYLEHIKNNNKRLRRLIYKLEVQIDNIARKRKEGIYK